MSKLRARDDAVLLGRERQDHLLGIDFRRRHRRPAFFEGINVDNCALVAAETACVDFTAPSAANCCFAWQPSAPVCT